MIIFGTGSTKTYEADLFYTCSHCANSSTTRAFVYTKYFDIFWIPVFPVGKYVSTQCSHCKQVLQEKEMPADLKLAALPLKQQSKTPLKAFAGLLIFAGLVALAGFFASQENKSTEKFAIAPQTGDRYYYKMSDGEFSSMRLAWLTSDSIYFSLNNYSIGKKSRIGSIDKTTNYDTLDHYGYSKNEITEMLKKNIVFKIKR